MDINIDIIVLDETQLAWINNNNNNNNANSSFSYWDFN